MSEYRAYIVGDDGHYRSSETIQAANDHAAIEAARKFCVGHGVELWILDRKIAVLPPENSRS